MSTILEALRRAQGSGSRPPDDADMQFAPDSRPPGGSGADPPDPPSPQDDGSTKGPSRLSALIVVVLGLGVGALVARLVVDDAPRRATESEVAGVAPVAIPGAEQAVADSGTPPTSPTLRPAPAQPEAHRAAAADPQARATPPRPSKPLFAEPTAGEPPVSLRPLEPESASPATAGEHVRGGPGPAAAEPPEADEPPEPDEPPQPSEAAQAAAAQPPTAVRTGKLKAAEPARRVPAQAAANKPRPVAPAARPVKAAQPGKRPKLPRQLLSSPPDDAPRVSLLFIQWSRNPERRVASLRGEGGAITIVREGDIVRGMLVAAIRPTGVEFEFRKQAFLVPVRR